MMNHLARITNMHAKLKRYGFTRKEIEEEFEISKATVKRDIEFMRNELRAPIIYSKELKRYIYDPDAGDFELPSVWLSSEELYGLILIYDFAKELSPGGFRNTFDSLIKNIEKAVISNKYNTLDILDKILIKKVEWRFGEHKYFRDILASLVEQKQIRITYLSRSSGGTESTRVLSPQKLLNYRYNWYLIAYCHTKNELRTFAVDRIEKLEILKEQSRRLPLKQITDYTGSQFGIFSGQHVKTAKIKFDAPIAEWIKDEKWHPDQESYFDENGNYILEVPYGNPTELIMEIMRYGEYSEILEPEELRNEIKTKLRQSMDKYK